MLVRDGKVVRGYLGVNIGTVTPAIAKEHKLGASSGVVVAGVQANGPAAKAHLVEGDVIVALDGQTMKSGGTLRNTIAMIKPGTNVTLDVVHQDGSKAKVKATLGLLPEQQQTAQEDIQGFQAPPGWDCKRTPQGIQCQKSVRRP
jgi:serine protease DegS